MQWHSNISTNFKVEVDFPLHTLSAKNAVTWKGHVDDSAKGIYDMILGRDL